MFIPLQLQNQYSKLTNAKCQPEMTNFKDSFGLTELLAAGLNPTEQFVGSYRVDIYPVGDGRKLVMLNNTSSMKSLGYGILPEWERSKTITIPVVNKTLGPIRSFGNMRQAYWWMEP